jgi:hypothetical protein
MELPRFKLAKFQESPLERLYVQLTGVYAR